MRVQIRYFAAAREATGLEQETLELGDGATVGNAFELLRARHPELGPLAAQLRFAIGTEFAGAADPVPAGATLALIPPVGGG